MSVSISFFLLAILWGMTGCKVREVTPLNQIDQITQQNHPFNLVQRVKGSNSELRVVTSKGRKIRVGYIPLIWEKYRKYDVNNDNSFSPVELEGIPGVELATMFKYIAASDKTNQFETINIQDAVTALIGLTDSKIARVLPEIFDNKILLTNYVRQIYQFIPERFIKILFYIKESPYSLSITGHPREGSNALLLISLLPLEDQKLVLKRVKKIDSIYQKNIKNQKLVIKAWEAGLNPNISIIPTSHKTPVGRDLNKVNEHVSMPDNSDIPEVFGHEYLVSTNKRHSFIQSNRSSFSIVLTFYDSRSKLGLMVNIDKQTYVHDSLDRVLQEFRLSSLQVNIFCGSKNGGREIVWDIKDRLSEGGISILGQYVLPDKQSNGIVLSLKTGHIYRYLETKSSVSSKIRAIRLSRIEKALNKLSMLFRHPDSMPSVGVLEISDLTSPNIQTYLQSKTRYLSIGEKINLPRTSFLYTVDGNYLLKNLEKKMLTYKGRRGCFALNSKSLQVFSFLHDQEQAIVQYHSNDKRGCPHKIFLQISLSQLSSFKYN